MIVLSRFPFPLEKGDKLRAYYLIQELAKKHEITLICTSDHAVQKEHLEKLTPYCSSIHVFPLRKWLIPIQLLVSWINGNPFQVGFFYQRWIHQRITSILQTVQPDAIYTQLIRTTEYVKDFHACPKTLDYMDALSKGMERRYEQARGFWKYIYRIEFQRLVQYERRIFDYFEHCTIISSQDRSAILHPNHKTIRLISNGVDPRFFSAKPSKKSIDILFTGNMSYPPNVDAARFLVQHIMPLVWSQIPHCSVVIAGAKPSHEVLKLSSDQVTVTGWVEDILPYYAEAKVFCAPMRLGSGLQNKLLEAMALGIPCVTTPLANNALEAKHAQEIWVAEQANDLADALVFLLEHENEARAMATAGQAHVARLFDWEQIGQQLSALLQQGLPQ